MRRILPFLLCVLSGMAAAEEARTAKLEWEHGAPDKQFFEKAKLFHVVQGVKLAFSEKNPNPEDLREVLLVLQNVERWADEFAERKKCRKAGFRLIAIRFELGVFKGIDRTDPKKARKVNVLGNTNYIGTKGYWIRMAFLSDLETLFHEFGHGIFNWEHPNDDKLIEEWTNFCRQRFDALETKGEKK